MADKVDRLEERLDKARMRIKRSEDRQVIESVFDTKTLLTLYHMFNKGLLDEINGVISTGKEANVYWGIQPDGTDVAIKIYRIATFNFKRITVYLEGDPRFSRIPQARSGLITAWASKEYKNLLRAEAAQVRVPHPIHVQRNLLVMEFIGEEGLPAPLMQKEKPEDPEKTRNTILNAISKLYHDAHLVHADLSEYNIMLWKEPVLIDLSQAVVLDHPHSEMFFERDVRNIINFFDDFDIPKLDLDETITAIRRGDYQ
ncbi:MAG: serine protein kinase RIO [Promethearchaeota archaeon]